MNTVIVTLSIIALCIVIIVQYANIVKLTRKVNDLKEEKIKAEVQRHDVVKIAKSILKILYTSNNTIPTDRIPFVSRENLLSIKSTKLDSIRLRLKDGKVIVYLNGLINPTKDVILLDNITSINNDHARLIETFIGVLEDSDFDAPTIPLTPQKIEYILTYNK